MKSASQYRAQAWKCLDGNWGMMILAGIVNGLSSMFPLVLYGPLASGMATVSLDVVRGKGADIERVFTGFYNFVNTMLLGMLVLVFTALWSLLFIVPGIVMGYAYSMSFYIMNDDTKIPPEEARKKSIEMMRGNKGRLFCLRLSFIGWLLLSMLTFGILNIFVVPYMETATAAFYEDLKNEAAVKANPAPAGTGSVFPELDAAERAMSDEKYCDVCGTLNPSVANYCKKCGNLLPEQTTVNMKNCPTCGKENIADAKFCKHCGNRIVARPTSPESVDAPAKTCPICGYENISSARYCKFCGADISTSACEPPASAFAPPTDDSLYASPVSVSAPLADATAPSDELAPPSAPVSDPTVQSGLKLCPLCGKTNVAASKFCNRCGSDLTGVETVKDPTETKRGGKHKNAQTNPVCPLCGKENIKNSKFCNKCGTPLAPADDAPTDVCPTCGGERAGTDVYCKYCGQRLK